MGYIRFVKQLRDRNRVLNASRMYGVLSLAISARVALYYATVRGYDLTVAYNCNIRRFREFE